MRCTVCNTETFCIDGHLVRFSRHKRPTELKGLGYLSLSFRTPCPLINTIGNVDGHVLLLVAHTVGEDKDGTEVIRLISARKADSKERKRYDQTR